MKKNGISQNENCIKPNEERAGCFIKKKLKFAVELMPVLLFISAVVIYIVSIIESIITKNIPEIISNLVIAIVLRGLYKLYEASRLD